MAIAVLVALAIFSGCEQRTTIHGRVTYEGQPVKKGTITFWPTDGQGPSAGGAIVDGMYSAQVGPGKKRVQIAESKDDNHPLSRDELEKLAAEAARKSRLKGGTLAIESGVPDAEGNNVEIEVKLGDQMHDFLLKHSAKKSTPH
jgi:hypothetical protein